jgi:hypothetical protein
MTNASVAGSAGLTATQTSGYAQTVGSVNCGYPYQNQWYYSYPYYVTTPSNLEEVIASYKKHFGKDWKKVFAQTVKVETR